MRAGLSFLIKLSESRISRIIGFPGLAVDAALKYALTELSKLFKPLMRSAVGNHAYRSRE